MLFLQNVQIEKFISLIIKIDFGWKEIKQFITFNFTINYSYFWEIFEKLFKTGCLKRCLRKVSYFVRNNKILAKQLSYTILSDVYAKGYFQKHERRIIPFQIWNL